MKSTRTGSGCKHHQSANGQKRFLWQKGGYFRKGLEVYFTFMIEKIWGKERILETYLNVAEMGKVSMVCRQPHDIILIKMPKPKPPGSRHDRSLPT